jgi:hypothetical protein
MLRKTIKAFYGKDQNAPYLPTTITSGVTARLTQIESVLATIKTAADDPEAVRAPELLPGLLEMMDDAYAFCLQYGIISFGFGVKVVQEQINLVQGAVTDVENAKAAFVAKLTKISESIEPSIEEARHQAAAAKVSADASATELASATSTKTTIDNLHVTLANLVKTAAENSQIVATAVKTAQASETQATTSAAAAKQSNTEIAEAKAVVEGRRNAINDFFTEITAHREVITATKKQSGDDAAELKRKSELDVGEFRKLTEQITAENKNLQSKIKDHLEKAVGVGLFSTFETRRKGAETAAWWWATLLVIITVGAAITAGVLAQEFASGKISGAILLARLAVAVPIGFLITFLSRQYSRNKHAEDEYAFKASISVSLDPFRALIEKMRKDGNIDEIPFVLEYVKEIYDNPTKRLYPVPIPQEVTADTAGKTEAATNQRSNPIGKADETTSPVS